MKTPTDAVLYERGMETLLASWAAYAHGSRDAALVCGAGVAAAVFPTEPERAFYNNALLERGLGSLQRTEALDTVESAYASAGVTRFAVWLHEHEGAIRDDLEARGYALDCSTRAMGMALNEIRVPRPELELASADWRTHLDIVGAPAGLLRNVDRSAFRVLVACLDGEPASSAIAFDDGDDCGIYNVSTLAHAQGHGLATAVIAQHLHEAAARGRRTVSLQATPPAERAYAALGFRDLGRILEYVPPV